jgi:hypothetical protein
MPPFAQGLWKIYEAGCTFTVIFVCWVAVCPFSEAVELTMKIIDSGGVGVPDKPFAGLLLPHPRVPAKTRHSSIPSHAPPRSFPFARLPKGEHSSSMQASAPPPPASSGRRASLLVEVPEVSMVIVVVPPPFSVDGLIEQVVAVFDGATQLNCTSDANPFSAATVNCTLPVPPCVSESVVTFPVTV